MLLPALDKHPVVLLGSAGTGTAFGAACALRRHWSNNVTIVAMDTNPRQLVTVSLLADTFKQVPLSSDESFPSVLLSLINNYNINTYLPLIDVEVANAAELRDSLSIPDNVCVLAPPSNSSRTCSDKYLSACWMEEKNIPTPQTDLASQPFNADAYFLKPRQGFGSRNTRKITNAELELMSITEREAFIVQALCNEPEITVDAFHDPARDFMRIACRERLETKSGVCTKARIFFDPELETIAWKLSRGLEILGTFCFQVMRGRSGWQVTDINLRPGAGTAISVAAGLDFFGALFGRAWGMDVRELLPMLIRERVVTRQYTEFVML